MPAPGLFTTTHTQILFMDFSSAFNTVDPHILCDRLLELEVNPTLILWIKYLLLDRPQHVVVNGFTSKNIVLNTRVPQGCVLSPIYPNIYLPSPPLWTPEAAWPGSGAGRSLQVPGHGDWQLPVLLPPHWLSVQKGTATPVPAEEIKGL